MIQCLSRCSYAPLEARAGSAIHKHPARDAFRSGLKLHVFFFSFYFYVKQDAVFSAKTEKKSRLVFVLNKLADGRNVQI